ncbi:MAG: ankyrin repeat domain-containing protein [Truepera sp.]|nr:ankyrin repeat domain-containing protein [Truepera sp.]
MKPRYLLLVISVLTLVGQGLAQGCQGWNTSEFFESATLAEVRGCLAAGVDVNAQSVTGTTPLHYAAFYTDDPAILRVLLDAGADVNPQGNAGTPLHAAVAYNTNLAIVPAITRVLLDAGADVNAQDLLGFTPLHLATFRTRPDPTVVEALLDAGADVNAQEDLYSWTPLHYAARFSRNPAVLEALLEAGADASARDSEGKTPWDYAQENEALRGTDAWWRLREGGLE